MIVKNVAAVLICPDWLIDRRHCSLRWASEVKAVRERLQEAVAQLPSHPIELKEASRPGELGLCSGRGHCKGVAIMGTGNFHDLARKTANCQPCDSDANQSRCVHSVCNGDGGSS